MSYIGRVEQKASDIRRFNVTGSTSATHTLTWTAPNEQSLIITINGVKQQEDAYSVSGTTLTLTSALVSTDKMEVVGILDIGEAVTPPDDSVSTIKIQDDAVTADKLANSINTEIAANTAKVTNATHTGDVTGDTALTIASGAVDLAMLSATGTADATTFLRGDNSWAAAGGGKVLQVLMMETTSSTAFASTTYADSNLTLNITPTSSSSQILIQWTVQVQIANGGQLRGLGFKLLRDSTAVYTSGSLLDIGFKPTTDNPYLKGSWYAIDSPATTSQITYKVQAASYNGYGVGFPSSSNGAQLLLWEIGA